MHEGFGKKFGVFLSEAFDEKPIQLRIAFINRRTVPNERPVVLQACGVYYFLWHDVLMFVSTPKDKNISDNCKKNLLQYHLHLYQHGKLRYAGLVQVREPPNAVHAEETEDVFDADASLEVGLIDVAEG